MSLFVDAETKEVITEEDFDSTFDALQTEDIGDVDLLPEETITGLNDLVPALGHNKFDGHVYVSGATGSGKSFFINKMLMNDKRKRKVWLFTDLPRRDVSLMPMFDSERLKIVREDANQDWEASYSEFHAGVEGSIIVFDDSNDPMVHELMNNALLKGRHRDVVVVAVNHKMRDYANTKHLLTDARYIVAFPSANRGTILNYMRDEFGAQPKLRRLIMKHAKNDGRQIIFHRFAPNTVATAKSIFLV